MKNLYDGHAVEVLKAAMTFIGMMLTVLNFSIISQAKMLFYRAVLAFFLLVQVLLLNISI